MRLLKKAAAVLESALLVFFFTGCWSYHELENLAIVSAVAVDEGKNGKNYHLSFECLNIVSSQGSGSTSGQGGQGGQNAQSNVLESDGNTIFEAIRNALLESGQKLYFSNCQEVIVSKEIAEEGLRKIIGFFISDAETRITLKFIISQEPTAEEILWLKPKTGQTVAMELSSSLEESEANALACLPLQLYEINNILSSEGEALTLPGVKIVRDTGKDPWAQLDQTAIFRDDRLAGWISEEQTKYLLFLRDKVQGGLIIPNPQNPGTTFEITESRTDIGVSFSGGRPDFVIHIKSDITADELEEGANQQKKGLSFSQLENIANDTVKTGVVGLIKFIQKNYGIDIFGFGRKISKEHPDEWNRMSKKWDSSFRNLSFQVKTDIKVVSASTLVERKDSP